MGRNIEASGIHAGGTASDYGLVAFEITTSELTADMWAGADVLKISPDKNDPRGGVVIRGVASREQFGQIRERLPEGSLSLSQPITDAAPRTSGKTT